MKRNEMSQKRNLAGWCCALVTIGAVVLPAAVASAQADGRRIYDEQLRVELDEQAPQQREIGADVGGWLSFALFSYDDALARKVRTLRQYQARAWAKANFRGVHQGYVRVLWGYDDWNTGDDPLGRDDEDTDFQLERAWYQLDVGRLLAPGAAQRGPVGLKVKVGRDYAQIGSALVLSLPLDLVQFDVTAGDWEFKALLGKSLSHTRNLDDSEPVARHMERCFYGLEAAYKGFARHRPYAYVLLNRDHTGEKPDDAFQSYKYDSNYVGVGSEGAVLLPDLRYLVEAVGEWGKNYSENQVTGRDRVCAFALDAQLEYLWRTAMRPKVSAEYLFASGDSDRRLSANSTIGGNLAGTQDNAFNAFGFRDTGLALAPRISNLHLYSLGASFFPLEKIDLFRKMEIGTKVFFYQKHRSGGPISDTGATKDSHWLGWEWDVFCDWRITSDLTWTVRYGAFRPGAAYQNDDCRDFVYTAFTYSF